MRVASTIETLAGAAGSAHMPQPNAVPYCLCFWQAAAPVAMARHAVGRYPIGRHL